MTFAKYVFIAAGLWGIAVLTPLFFLVEITGRSYAAPTDYPHFFYGFVAVAMAWQIAFLVIGSNPARFRLLMIPGFIEKAGYRVGCATTDHEQGEIDLSTGCRCGNAWKDRTLPGLGSGGLGLRGEIVSRADANRGRSEVAR